MFTVQAPSARTSTGWLTMMSKRLGCAALLAAAACGAAPGAASAVVDTKRVTQYPLERLQLSPTFTVATCKFRIMAGNYGTAPFAQLQHRSSGCRQRGVFGGGRYPAIAAIGFNFGGQNQSTKSVIYRSGVVTSQATFRQRPAISVWYSVLACGYSTVQRTSICRQVHGVLR